ncbi:MAG: hypothetical protein NTW87_18325 [Planctomycetota bacterium]|nr:hypothetical protein [Planctomycetota bacterium]
MVKQLAIGWFAACVTALAVGPTLVSVAACRAGEWELTRPAAQFDRCEFTDPQDAERVRKSGNLAGVTKPNEWFHIAGWAEYDIAVPQAGWYELLVPADLWGMEYVIDGKLSVTGGGGKIGNFWLEAGKHVIRLQRYHWTGFGKIEKLVVRASGPAVGKTVRMYVAEDRTIVRAGEELKLCLQAGGRAEPAKVVVRLQDTATKDVITSRDVELPAGVKPVDLAVPLACPREGVFEITLAEGDKPLDAKDLAPLTVIVADAKPLPRGGTSPRLQPGALLPEVDCVATEPQYAGAGGATLVDGPAGKYRESGDAGFLAAQHHNREPGWFAYKLAVPEAQKPYVLETDCPDDAFRTFCIAIREASPEAYPVAGGLDTGACFALSRKMQTHAILFWPRTTDLRVVFVTAHDGRRGAAVAKIRLYRVEGELPLLDVPVSGGRSFGNWYEEGSNFLAVYGAPDRGPRGSLIGADRWARAIAHVGGDTLAPTVAVYQMSLYPSRYNTDFADPGTLDIVRILLLKCEKYGLGLIGEFHPECRELDRLANPTGAVKPKPNALISKDGGGGKDFNDVPRFHPLHPVDQEWYLGMIGEFADRYKDSPAFRGVCLRLMSWVNPGLNNFHSLDWGYDDLTVGLFEKETGLSTGAKADDPKRFRARYDWLMAHARDRWIAWRCEKIAQLHTRIRDRVRRARPDLKVYVSNFDMLQDAGIDPQLLGAIEGVVLINSRHSYGRRAFTYEGPMADPKMRDLLLEPAALLSMRGPSGEAAFLFGAGYFEAVEKVVTPESLGFPQGTKRTWMSGVVNPAGRQFLERYALALAEADATYLADGGNAYTLGQPLLREFLAEYRKLPPVAFRPRPDARDPVAVWELSRKEDLLFYAVNRERYPVQVTLALKTNAPVRRLATGEELGLKDGQLAFELQPYQLLAFQAPAGAKITKVSVAIPEEDRRHVASLVNALEDLNIDVEAGKTALGAEGKTLLGRTLEEARQCLKEGRFWRARTMMEHHRLAEQVYNKTLVFPPTLEYLAEPANLKLLRAKGLTKPKDPVLHIRFDEMEAGKTPAAGKLAPQVQCEGACELREGRFGRALRLDGKTGRGVIQADGAGGLNLKNLTLSVWVNAENVGERRGIVARQRSSAGYALLFWNGSLLAEAGSQEGNAGFRTDDGLFRPGQWYHVAATFESGKAVTLYVDGIVVKKAALKHAVDLADSAFLIGWNGWCGRQNDQTPGWFAGRIDELKIWDRVLSADEVLAEWGGKE